MIATSDPANGNALQVIPDSEVQWTSAGKWPDLTVEQYSMHNLKTPEFAIPHHALTMHLSSPSLIEITIGGEPHTYLHSPSDMSLFAAGLPRQVRTSEPLEVLIVAVSPDVLAQAALESGKQSAVELVENARFYDPQCEHLAKALKAEAETNCASGFLYGDSLALALAAHFVESHSVLQNPLELKGGLAPRALRRVLEYIQENLDTQLRMNSLALVAGLSEFRFAHNFKRATGLAPHQYVTRARIERGQRMLRQTNMSILEIALAVGFGNANRFTTCFRRTLGFIPSAYRAAFR